MPGASPVRVVVAAVLAGTAAAAVWTLASRATSGRIPPPPLAYMLAPSSWKSRILTATLQTESGGKYTAMNLNKDGAGLSFGLIQWAQKPGSLGSLLAAMQARDPARFASIFGPDSAALVASTKTGSLAPVGGAVLWAEPWVSRFKLAGSDPVFKAVQDDMIFNGIYMSYAVDAARILGGQPTERGLALLFDTAVNQGGYVKTLAGQAAAMVPGGSFDDRLKAFVQIAPARFKSTAAAAPSTSWRWVGDAWHKFAGSFDLHKSISSRVARIMSSPLLTDEPVSLV